MNLYYYYCKVIAIFQLLIIFYFKDLSLKKHFLQDNYFDRFHRNSHHLQLLPPSAIILIGPNCNQYASFIEHCSNRNCIAAVFCTTRLVYNSKTVVPIGCVRNKAKSVRLALLLIPEHAKSCSGIRNTTTSRNSMRSTAGTKR